MVWRIWWQGCSSWLYLLSVSLSHLASQWTFYSCYGVQECWCRTVQVLDVTTMQQRMKDLNCVDVSPTGTSTSSPEHPPSSGLPSSTPTPTPTPSPASGTLGPAFGDDSSSYCSDGSQVGGNSPAPPHHRGRSKLSRARKLLHQGHSKAEDHGALSDSECQPTSWRQQYLKDANSNHTKVCVWWDT
jgi:hypothetical protein